MLPCLPAFLVKIVPQNCFIVWLWIGLPLSRYCMCMGRNEYVILSKRNDYACMHKIKFFTHVFDYFNLKWLHFPKTYFKYCFNTFLLQTCMYCYLLVLSYIILTLWGPSYFSKPQTTKILFIMNFIIWIWRNGQFLQVTESQENYCLCF